MSSSEVGVLVIGAGPTGLASALLLEQQGVETCIVERRAGPQRAPAAHVIRKRPMEVLSLLGVDAEIRRQMPKLPIHYIVWCATLGGAEAGRLDLRASRDAGADPDEEIWTNCPQNRLEPVLLERARRAPEATIVAGAEVVALDELDEGPERVRARVRGRDGRESEVEAGWVIAADGAGSPPKIRNGPPSTYRR